MCHDLPVMAVCPDVVRALEERGGVVVTAPPGAGKSTGLPLAVLDAFPDGKIIGLSKIPRIVEMYARRLQVQERLTEQVCEAVESILHPQGIAVLTNGLHMCSIMRGVKKESAELITTRFTGVFEKDPVLRDDFYRQIGLPEPEE